MTGVCLGIGGEREDMVFIFGLGCKPLLLFRHGRGIRGQKGQSIESTVEKGVVQLSRLRLLDYLPGLVEALQREQSEDNVFVYAHSDYGYTETLTIRVQGLLILSLREVHVAQTAVSSPVSWITLNLFLIRLCRLIQFPDDIQIVVAGDSQFFALTGMFPQLKCLVVVLAGPP